MILTTRGWAALLLAVAAPANLASAAMVFETETFGEGDGPFVEVSSEVATTPDGVDVEIFTFTVFPGDSDGTFNTIASDPIGSDTPGAGIFVSPVHSLSQNSPTPVLINPISGNVEGANIFDSGILVDFFNVDLPNEFGGESPEFVLGSISGDTLSTLESIPFAQAVVVPADAGTPGEFPRGAFGISFFNGQGEEVAFVGGEFGIPEPASVGLLIVAATAGLARSRRSV